LPGQASLPNPASGSTNASTIVDLSWTAGSDATSHDFYFGTSNPPLFVQNQNSTSYDPGTISESTTYFWRIDEKNDKGITEGTVWSFKTAGPLPAPGQASSPFPANGSTNILTFITALDLSWTIGSNATSHDVYFGTSNPPLFIQNQTSTRYAPGTLSDNTTYYWRVDEKNDTGTTVGPVWSFTTASNIGISNLALFKPVAFSSEQDITQEGASPEQGAATVVDGIDNNINKRWSASPFPQWVEVDLGQDYLISSTELVCSLDRDYQFIVEVKTDGGSTYTQVVDRLNNMDPGSAANPITNTFSETTARYVRLPVTGAGTYKGAWISILEFRVFGRETLSVGFTTMKINPANFTINNSPNPFNSITNIHFVIPDDGHVIVRIFNLMGKEIAEVVNSRFNAGSHTIVWDAHEAYRKKTSAGQQLYLLELKFNNQVKTSKMALIAS
jgi:hypothetical protein